MLDTLVSVKTLSYTYIQTLVPVEYLDPSFGRFGYEFPTHFAVLRIWEFRHCSIDQLGFFFKHSLKKELCLIY
jgi:hypothetical protein